MEINNVLQPIDMQKILFSLRHKGYTEVEIATLLGTNQSTVSRIISGKVRRPRGQAAERLQQIHDQMVSGF